MVTLHHYLLLSAMLFALGAIGVMFRRNLIVILMSLELMLNAVNLTFIAFSRYLGSIEGQVFVLFIMVVAAAEVAVGLARSLPGTHGAGEHADGPGERERRGFERLRQQGGPAAAAGRVYRMHLDRQDR